MSGLLSMIGIKTEIDYQMSDHYCPDCYDVEVINGVYNVKAKEK